MVKNTLLRSDRSSRDGIRRSKVKFESPRQMHCKLPDEQIEIVEEIPDQVN